MSLIVVHEYGRIERSRLGKALERRLHRFDDRHAKSIGDHVFDWRFEKYVRAKSYVGVVHIPGLTVEILPKIDDSPIGDGPLAEGSEMAISSRRNLLYMLSLFLLRIIDSKWCDSISTSAMSHSRSRASRSFC